MVPIEQFYKNLPQSEKLLLSQCAPLMEDGDKMALEMLQAAYDPERHETEKAAARLYFGASVREPLALLTLGRYHLHGFSVFPRDAEFAIHCLSRAAESKNKAIAEAAARELMVYKSPRADFDLAYRTLEHYNCYDKPVVALPPYIQDIKPKAFMNHPEIEVVILPQSLIKIGWRAFEGCTSLKEIRFPKGLRSIGDYAFQKCTALEKVEFPEDLTYLGENAFQKCTALERVRLPRNLSHVGAYAFAESGLKEAYLGKNTASIGKWAFSNTPLERFYFYDALTLVESCAFDGCKNLNALYSFDMLPPNNTDIKVKSYNDAFKNSAVMYCEESRNEVCTVLPSCEPEFGEWETLEGMPSRQEEKGYYTDAGSGFDGPLIWLP